MSIFLPWLATDRLRRYGRLPKSAVVLAVTTVAQAQRVQHCCARAYRAGVRSGMTLAHARAILPHVDVRGLDHDARRDVLTLEALARWSERFSPVVSVDSSVSGCADGLLVDITGCEHLFGGEMPIALAVRDGLALLGFTARIGVASTVGAAWAAARFGTGTIVRVPTGEERRALAPLSVAALRVEADIVEALREVAIESVGEVFDLPRSTLPARYGDELLRRIDQALGTLPEPIARLPDRVSFIASRELPGGTTQVEAIEAALKWLLGQLRQLLERQESGLRRLEITFDRLDAATITMRLLVTRPTRNEKHLWTLIRPRVERLEMGYGIERITLAASHVARMPHPQEFLPYATGCGENTKADDAAFAETLDTIANRFGANRVVRIESRASHLPEHAMCFVSIHEPPAKPEAAASARWFTPADRPSRLLSRPEPVRVVALTPDGPVVRLWRKDVERRVLGSIGPERIGAAWWSRREPARDYFRVQEETGRWLWLYQDRTTRAWFVHGEWV